VFLGVTRVLPKSTASCLVQAFLSAIAIDPSPGSDDPFRLASHMHESAGDACTGTQPCLHHPCFYLDACQRCGSLAHFILSVIELL
jgi:hypothetical protein